MFLPIFETYPLHDGGLQRLLQEQKLSLDPFPKPGQFQPATLDVRVGSAEVYDAVTIDKAQRELEAKRNALIKKANGDMRKIYFELTELESTDAPIRYDAGSDLLIPHLASANITLEETIKLDYDYHLEAELRSSRGRAHFELKQCNDLGSGRYQLSIHNPNPNDLIIPATSKFAQLFIYANKKETPHDGRTLNDPDEVAALFPGFAKQNLITPEGYLVFKVGQEALRFNTFREPLHLDHMPPKEELYTTINLEKGYVHRPGEALVVQLDPAIKLPADVGVLLKENIPIANPRNLTGPFFNPYVTDSIKVKAGWIDPGFPALDKGPATVTGHAYNRSIPHLLQTGMIFAFGIVYKYDTPVNNPYGSEHLGSHYSNVKGLSGTKS